MICQVPFRLRAFIYPAVFGVPRRKRPDSARSHELVVDDLHNCHLLQIVDRRIRKIYGKELVRTDIQIPAVIVHIIGKISGLLVPERFLEVLFHERADMRPSGRE